MHGMGRDGRRLFNEVTPRMVLYLQELTSWVRWKNLDGLFQQNKCRYLHNPDVRRSMVGRNYTHILVSVSSLIPIFLARVSTSPFAISVECKTSSVSSTIICAFHHTNLVNHLN